MAAAPPAQSRLETLRTLRNGILDVAFSTAFLSLVGGIFLIGFVKALGGGDLWIGLISGLPAFAGIFQILGGVWGRRFPGYRGFVLPGGITWRALHIPLVILTLPFLPLPNEARLAIMLVCLTVAAISVQIVGPIYSDWVAQLTPPTQRGAYISRRTLIATLVGVPVGLIGGVVMDYCRSIGQEISGYTILFSLGCVCALISQIFCSRMGDLPRPDQSTDTLRQAVRSMANPLKDANFKRVLWFVVLFSIGQNFAGGLFIAFALERLKLDFTLIQITGVSAAIGTALTIKFFGYLADRLGNKPILTLLTLIIVVTPLMWLLCEPGQPVKNATILFLGHILTGIGWSGVGLTMLNMYVATAKEGERSSYIGMAGALQSLALGVSPIVGAQIMHSLRVPLGDQNAYATIFIATTVLRAISLIPLALVREPGARGVRETVRFLRRVTPSRVRALRQLTETADESSREAAAIAVGSASLDLATAELEHTLADPSPRVRRQAALALGRIGGREAGEAILRHIRSHPDLVEEETLEALGDAAPPGAAEALAPFLRDPRSPLRRTAAKALGRLGDPKAVAPLREAAAQTGDPEMRRGALQALRNLGGSEAAEEIGSALFDTHPSVRVAAAEAIAELGLIPLAPTLREALAKDYDPSASELAYTLGVIGDRSDAGLITRNAALVHESDTHRRRALLGLARLAGVEREAYRLLLAPEFTRDAALENELRPALKRSARLRRAFELYTLDQEQEAVTLLVGSPLLRWMAPLADHPLREAFFVVGPAFVRASNDPANARSLPEDDSKPNSG